MSTGERRRREGLELVTRIQAKRLLTVTAGNEGSFVEDGSIIIQDVGLSVRVTGSEDFLLDVGWFVVCLNPNELLQSSCQHPIREINPFSVSDPALLGAFGDRFD